jgi:hypothetical protein
LTLPFCRLDEQALAGEVICQKMMLEPLISCLENLRVGNAKAARQLKTVIYAKRMQILSILFKRPLITKQNKSSKSIAPQNPALYILNSIHWRPLVGEGTAGTFGGAMPLRLLGIPTVF